ncbi:hypothetical protein AAHA92_30518 [Salvia divinorum]|uniref:Uncharacterized protein n=1 Tax=Salvia divinorum TaxID=28513 RepID=A0ABD1FR51_SALDI
MGLKAKDPISKRLRAAKRIRKPEKASRPMRAQKEILLSSCCGVVASCFGFPVDIKTEVKEDSCINMKKNAYSFSAG